RLGEAGPGMGAPACDRLRRNLADSCMGLFQPAAYGAHGVDGERGMALEDRVPAGDWPGEGDALGRRHGRAGVVGALEGPGDAEELAWHHHADDDLLALRRDLGDAQATVKEDVEILRRGALFEDARPRLVAAAGRERDDVVEGSGIHA